MEGSYNPEVVHRPSPRGPKIFKTFKNPPQPHMCIQDSIRGTSEKLYINVMSWKQIANTKQCADLIPLYGGMPIPQGCTPNCNKPPLIIFAVMVNPEILKINGKNATNPQERDALVNLLCDFVEAMNPGLYLTKKPVILKDRDLAGELKDVWHAVQIHREKEKMKNQALNPDVTHKIYHIDGPDQDPRVSNSVDRSELLEKDSTNSAVSDNNCKNQAQILSENVNSSVPDQLKPEQTTTSTSECSKTLNTPQNVSTNTMVNQVDDICNKLDGLETKESLSANLENGTNLTDQKIEKIDTSLHAEPKNDKQKHIYIKNQTPTKSNSKKILTNKSKYDNSDNQHVLLNGTKSESDETKIDADLESKKQAFLEISVNLLKSIKVNDVKIRNNPQLSNENSEIVSVDFDIDSSESTDKMNNQSYQQSNNDVKNSQKCIVESVKNNCINLGTQVSNADDQNEVPLSSQ